MTLLIITDKKNLKHYPVSLLPLKAVWIPAEWHNGNRGLYSLTSLHRNQEDENSTPMVLFYIENRNPKINNPNNCILLPRNSSFIIHHSSFITYNSSFVFLALIGMVTPQHM